MRGGDVSPPSPCGRKYAGATSSCIFVIFNAHSFISLFNNTATTLHRSQQPHFTLRELSPGATNHSAHPNLTPSPGQNLRFHQSGTGSEMEKFGNSAANMPTKSRKVVVVKSLKDLSPKKSLLVSRAPQGHENAQTSRKSTIGNHSPSVRV